PAVRRAAEDFQKRVRDYEKNHNRDPISDGWNKNVSDRLKRLQGLPPCKTEDEIRKQIQEAIDQAIQDQADLLKGIKDDDAKRSHSPTVPIGEIRDKLRGTITVTITGPTTQPTSGPTSLPMPR